MQEFYYEILEEKNQKWIQIHYLNFDWRFLVRDFLKIGSSFVHCNYIMEKIGLDCYETNDVIIRKNCGSYDIIYWKKSNELIEVEFGFVKKQIALNKISVINESVIKIINHIIDLDNFDCKVFQPIYLSLILSNYLSVIEKIKIDKIYVNELYTYDEGRQVRLPESNKVRALRKEFDLNSISQKISNLKNQTNLSRLQSSYKEIAKYGYPFKGQYIVLYNNENVIRDGGHRAACLYEIHGNVEIPVMRIYLNYEKLFTNEKYLFPFHIVSNPKNVLSIVIYGAGKVGQAYVRQINNAGKPLELCKWVDKKYDIWRVSDFCIDDPKCLPKLNYDYIIIAIESHMIAEEIKKELIDMGIDDKKIIWKNPVQSELV